MIFVEKKICIRNYIIRQKDGNYDIVVCGNYNVVEDYSRKTEDTFVSSYSTDLENIFFW
ncbi:MAG: hypothetical protein L6V91_03320 [Bacilli bacterium]|nr:MAG: hypothetical protein L6V91_03320 [Bacilli bacterium]